MMVRNAVRVIVLTVFKLSDEAVNELLGEVPFCSYFAHLACFLRDKVLDVDQSYQTKGKCTFDSLNHCVEEMQDLMEFLQEIFECDNSTVSDMLTNSLLFYCYYPVILGSLASETKPIISISTAQFILIRSFSVFKYQPLVNSVVGALLLDRVPRSVLTAIDKYPDRDPSTYKFKWRLRQPS